MPNGKGRPNQALKLEIKVIPRQYRDMPLSEIAHLMGDGPLLWPGGAGRVHAVKFVHDEVKKKRGRKPKNPERAARSKSAEKT
jgi:hypothetical protein